MAIITSSIFGVNSHDVIQTLLEEFKYNVLEYTNDNFDSLIKKLEDNPFQHFLTLIEVTDSDKADCKFILYTLMKLLLIIKQDDRYVWDISMISQEKLKPISFYLISALINLTGQNKEIDENYDLDEYKPERTKYLIYLAVEHMLYEDMSVSKYVFNSILLRSSKDTVVQNKLTLEHASKIYELIMENPKITNKSVLFEVAPQESRDSKLGKYIIQFIKYIRRCLTNKGAKYSKDKIEFIWLNYINYGKFIEF